MHGFSGKRFSWLLAGSAAFDPYASALATYAVPRRDAGVPQTLADKLEALVRSAYDQGDREIGWGLAVVLRNVLRRDGAPVPESPPDVRLPRLSANDP